MRAYHASIVVGLALLGCGGTGTGGSEPTGGSEVTSGSKVTGGAEGTLLTLDHEAITLDPRATAHVTLWGYDFNLADASATAIARYTIEVDALPVDLELDIPEDPHTLIDQGHGPVEGEDAHFYFSIRVDVDGDGQVCEKDFIQDFDRSEWTSFRMEPPKEHKVFVEESGSSCHPIDL